MRPETVNCVGPIRSKSNQVTGQLEIERVEVKTEKRFFRTSITKLVPSKYDEEEKEEEEEEVERDEEEGEKKEKDGGKRRNRGKERRLELRDRFLTTPGTGITS